MARSDIGPTHRRGLDVARLWGSRHCAPAPGRSGAVKPLPDIVIQEVAPRDGLQIESRWVETGEKIRLVDSLSAMGFRRIEVSSFVSPKADSESTSWIFTIRHGFQTY